MALTISQEYTYFEQGLGATTVRFVVSNDYESLFNQTTDWTTGIISLEDCSEDLNINDGAFAVNQLTFKINALTCVTEHDTNTLYFLLGATDRTKYRFCALFFNPAYTAGKCNINTLKFIGRIEDKISADDIAWFNAAQYSADIQAVRDWKFSAQSFDVSILDSVSIKSIYEGYFAPGNITETPDIAGITDAEINALFEHKPNYLDIADWVLPGGFPLGDRFRTYTMNLGLLYSALELLINKAELIIADIINVPTFTIELMPTELGYEACPVWYFAPKATVPDGSPGDSYKVTKVESVPAVRIPLELSNSAANGIYIHKRMVKSSSLSERSMNFQRFDNLSDLLFAIARNFGLYLMFEYVTGTHIRISLTSRADITDTDFTYIINASTGKLDISSDAKSGGNKTYIGQANNYCGDGFDNFLIDRSRTPQLSTRIGKTSDGQTKSGERLLFTTSPTMQFLEDPRKNPNGQYPPNDYLPQNVIFRVNSEFKTDLNGTSYPASQEVQELLHTAIYVRTSPSVYEDLLQVETEPFVWRPVAHLFVNRSDKDITYNTLADFITDIENYDREFYKFEREYTIPYWSGFSKFTTGASPSVHNIKLGAKIKFEETLRVLNETTNVFADETVEEIYVVVGVKRKLGSPETTIKLHRTSRYAYSSFAGDDPEPAALLISPSIAAALPTVRCVYTSQVSLSGITATDGITPASGDSVLVSNNTDPKENGPYIVQSGAWERTDLVLGAGVIINVREGTVNAGSNWMVTTPKEIITIGTDNITFKRTDASSILDGSGIVPINKGGTGASTSAGARSNLGLGTIATQNSNSVAITGGSITGLNALSVTDASDSQMSVGITDSASMTAINNGQLTFTTSLGNMNFNTTGGTYIFDNADTAGRMYLFFTGATSGTNVFDVTKSNGGNFAKFEYLKPSVASNIEDGVTINAQITSSDGINAGSLKYQTTTAGASQSGAWQIITTQANGGKIVARFRAGEFRLFSETTTKYVEFKYNGGITDNAYSLTLPNNPPSQNNSVILTATDGTQSWSMLRKEISAVNINNVPATSFLDVTVTVTGANTSQCVTVNRVGGFGDLIVCHCRVSAADTVIFRLYNPTASDIDLPSETLIISFN